MEGVVRDFALAHGGDAGYVGQHASNFFLRRALPSLPIRPRLAVGLGQNEGPPPDVWPLALILLDSSQPDRCVVDEGSSVVVKNRNLFLFHNALLLLEF